MCVMVNLWQICDAVCPIMRIVRDSTISESHRFVAELVRMLLARVASA